MSATPEQVEVPDGGLRSEAVRLRGWRIEESPTLAAAWADPDVARWTAVPLDASVEAARRWIGGDMVRRRAGRSVDFVINEPARPAVAGEIGLAPIDWERRATLVGYWLLPEWRGRGLAVAALRLLTPWAVATMSLRLLVARCHPDNSASVAVAEGAGYSFERVDSEGFHLYVYRAPATSC